MKFESEIEIPKEYNYLSAFLTMRCNFKCSYCLNAFEEDFYRKNFKEIPGERWVEGLNKLKPRKGLPITFSGGEPREHGDLVYIINNLRPDFEIDLLTNLHWGKRYLEKFANEVSPDRIKRDSPYPSIRASYHPEQMGNGDTLIKNTKFLQENGFSIGLYSVQYPSPKNLQAITQMQFRCKNEGIEFRIKDFTGKFEGEDDFGTPFSITYGDYSKYPSSAFSKNTSDSLCKTGELLIGPDGDVYKCHRDLYAEEFSVGNLLDSSFKIEWIFRECNKYGNCHPCDVKVKTDSKQKVGYTSVEIKFRDSGEND